MTWPTAQVKTEFDAGTDDPKQARSEFAGNVDKFNLLQAHVSNYIQGLLDDADAAAARATLGLGTAALKNTGTSGDAVPLLNASADYSGAFLLSGTISPSQITANQNNYNPSGLSGAVQLRLSTDASRNLTGIAGGADGRLLLITNITSADLVLTSEDALSTAGNRFLFAGGDRTLTADESVLLRYDGTSSRWRAADDAIFITRETPVATTSGTAHGFTGIAAGANRITMMLLGVSLTASDLLLIQIGDSGGYETSDYLTGASVTTASTGSTAGFLITRASTSGALWSGSIILTRENSNNWVSQGNLFGSADDFVHASAGRGPTAMSELDRIQITRDGSDTFDAGSVNIFVE